jgi:hypothetical protein
MISPSAMPVKKVLTAFVIERDYRFEIGFSIHDSFKLRQ